MWKKVFAAFTILGLVLFFLARDKIVEGFVKRYFDDYCLESFGCQMQFKNGQHLNHQLSFEKPAISTTEALQDGGVSFSADKISIAYTFHWLRFCLDLDVRIENPVVSLKNDVDIKLLAERFWQGGTILPVRPSVAIIGGAFHFHDFSAPVEKVDSIYYALDLNLRGDEYGYLQMSFGDPTLQSNALEIALSRDDKTAVDFKAAFRKLDLASISQMLFPLYEPLKSWHVGRGSLDGALAARRLKGKRLESEGKAFLRSLQVGNRDLGLMANLGEIQIDFTRDGNTVNTTVGKLAIGDDCSLVIEHDDLPIWKISNMLGEVAIESHDGAKINLHGKCASGDHSFDFNIHGDGRYFDDGKKFLKLNLALVNQEGGEASAFVVMKQLNDLWNSIDINLQNFGFHEFEFVQGAMSRYSEDWRDVRLNQGTFNASVILNFKELQLQHLKVKKFAAKDVLFDYFPLNLNGNVEQAKGFLAVNFGEPDILQTLNTELSIDGGMVRIVEDSGKAWQLSDVETKLVLHDGVIQKSNVKGDFLGLEGNIVLDWLSDDEIMKIKFQGMPRNLNAPVPELLKRGIDSKFSEDMISMTAGLKVKNERLYVEGILEVEDAVQQVQDDIAFGFIVEKIRPELRRSSQMDIVESDEMQRLGQEVLQMMMPAMASPSLLLNKGWLEGEKGISGLILRDGWIYAENLPIEKYVAPFAFQPVEGEDEHPLLMTGFGDFRGVFDHTGLSVLYNIRQMTVENDNFHFEVDTLFCCDEENEQKNTLGYHYASFANGQHFGVMPVKHGTYLEKNSGLLFNEVSTNLKFKGKQMHVTELETYCSGIHFGGNININCDYADPGSFDVEIIADTMNGKVSQLQNLFSHFEKPPLFTEFPMEGDLHFRDQGAYLLCNVRPEATTMQTRFQVALSDGFVALRPLDVSIQEFGMHIDYDQKSNYLVMSEILGSVLVGRGSAVDEYILTGDKIAFTDFKNNVSEFDLWIGDRKRDMIRIAGISKGSDHGEQSLKTVHFELDRKKTHFGDVYPTTFAFSLVDWTKIENFQLDFSFRLSTLFKDLQRLSRSGIFFAPVDMLEEFNNLKEAHGDFNVNLSYDQNAASFRYALDGKNIEFLSHSFDILQLSGKVRDRTWAIDQLRLDDISVAAEVMRMTDRWRVNFLGLRRGESLLLGLDGDYSDQSKNFDGNINLLEIDLSHLDEWPQFTAFAQKNSPKGFVKGKGKLQLCRAPGTGSWICDASLSASACDLQLRDVAFADASNFSCHLLSDRGMILRNVTTAMLSSEDSSRQVPMRIEKIDYDMKVDELDVERVHFSILQKDLNWFAATLQKAMPEDVSDRTVEVISSVKDEGVVNAIVSMEQKGDYSLLKMSLEDDVYRFADTLHHVRDFQLSHAPGDFSAQMEYLYQQRPLLMQVLSEDPDIDYGTIVLADKIGDQSTPDPSGIVLQWVVDPLYGFMIREAKGKIAGLELHVHHDGTDHLDRHYHQLKGWANVSLPTALNLCESDFIQSCTDNKIGGNYLFKGKWSIGKDKKVDSYFVGDVQGQDVIMKGYQFDTLNAHFNYSTKKAVFSDLELRDVSGYMTVPALTLTYWTDEQWWFHLPELQISNFRPGILRDTQAKNQSSGKTLVINKINISDIKGKLADSATWLGKGMLKFSNPPKSSLQNTIFAIPHEIITRIGLNPAVLTPVAGTIYYDIKNGKVVFTKFKDVYSESRASKFYLPNSSMDSYVDFDGNIFIQVKMKQYNLLFKLAELFTFNVKGTLDKPVYMIQKQEAGK